MSEYKEDESLKDMDDDERLWMDSYGFIYLGDGKRLLKGANIKGAYWIPEGVEERFFCNLVEVTKLQRIK